MNSKPLVSIIIQTYNRAHIIYRAIDSAINQTYTNLEIIISDNHSEDNTEEICKRYAEKDNRIKYFRQKENIGMIRNANFALQKISGDYFIWLNDDDWLDKDVIEKCVNILEEKKSYSFITPVTMLFKKKSFHRQQLFAPYLEDDNISVRLQNFILCQDYAKLSSGVFRTYYVRKMLENDGVALKDRYNEDIVFMIKYLVAGKSKVLINTHYNKLDEGNTATLETTRPDIYDSAGINYSNIGEKRGKIFSNAIIEDEYFKQYLSLKQRNKIAKEIYETLIFTHYYSRLRDMLKYMYSHPLFIFRKDFYKKLKFLMISKKHTKLYNFILYCWQHPLFLLRKDFYQNYLGILK